MEISRGDLVSAVVSGDYGKLRPVVVVQSDMFSDLPSVTILPLTSDLKPSPLLRIEVQPSPENNLRRLSHIMVDKLQTVTRGKIGQWIGRIDRDTMRKVEAALARFLALE